MESIALPLKTQYQPGKDAHSGRLVVEPLYPGYGTTVGNSLRRVLLSSLPGAAVTAVRIHNAPHEFTTLPKVQEDILQLILNLKRLRCKVYSDEPVQLHLKTKGEKVVLASEIDKNSQVEIVTPDLPIATLTSRDAELEMDLWVSQGRGFVTTESREKERMEIGVIAVDALFSPVRHVAFEVEGARVGQMTNYDKLILDVETDGTITPAEACQAATQILIDHFTLLTSMLPAAEATAPSLPEAEVETDGEETSEGDEDAKPRKAKKAKAAKEE